jgi:hypothetical protein
MAFLSRESRAGVPKSRQLGLPGLWGRITSCAKLRSQCGLKQSCSSRRELSNGMWHVVCSQVFRVDSRLLVVGSQNWQTPGTSTLGPSFGHNLCFRCPNEQCKPILDIYTSRAFHWDLTLQISLWSFGSPFGSPTLTNSQRGSSLGSVRVHSLTLSGLFALPGACDVTPGSTIRPAPCNPFALVASPKLGLRQIYPTHMWLMLASCSLIKTWNFDYKLKLKKGHRSITSS